MPRLADLTIDLLIIRAFFCSLSFRETFTVTTLHTPLVCASVGAGKG